MEWLQPPSLTLRETFGKQGNTSFSLARWSVFVALTTTKEGVVYMNVNTSLETTIAIVVVTNAPLYTTTTYFDSSGNILMRSTNSHFKFSHTQQIL